MLFPDACPPNQEGCTRDEQQVQNDDTNDSGLKDLQSIQSSETVHDEFRSIYLLAPGEEDDGQRNFCGIVECDYEQIAQNRAEVQRHLLSAPLEELFQRNDSDEGN